MKDLHSVVDWVARIKASCLSNVVEEIMEKQDLESDTTPATPYSVGSQETDLTDKVPSKKRKLEQSCEEVSPIEVDLTKNFQP